MNSRRHRVLLVEDHESYALTLATVLAAERSVEVVGHASDGRAGVELALAERPDVVLMDVYMPVLDGIEATRELHERLPETAVVVLSSSDLGDDIARAREAGAVAYCLKDAPLEQLLETIAAAAGRPARAAAPPRAARRTVLRFSL